MEMKSSSVNEHHDLLTSSSIIVYQDDFHQVNVDEEHIPHVALPSTLPTPVLDTIDIEGKIDKALFNSNVALKLVDTICQDLENVKGIHNERMEKVDLLHDNVHQVRGDIKTLDQRLHDIAKQSQPEIHSHRSMQQLEVDVQSLQRRIKDLEDAKIQTNTRETVSYTWLGVPLALGCILAVILPTK